MDQLCIFKIHYYQIFSKRNQGFEFVVCLFIRAVLCTLFVLLPFQIAATSLASGTKLKISCSNHNFLWHVILSIQACFYSVRKLIYIRKMISFGCWVRINTMNLKRLQTRYRTCLKMLTTALLISFVLSSSSRNCTD